jgi:hypothetical protein
VDFLVPSDATDHERFVCVSFSTSRKATEEYHHQHSEEIFRLLESALESSPALQGFTVGVNSPSHWSQQSSLRQRHGTDCENRDR